MTKAISIFVIIIVHVECYSSLLLISLLNVTVHFYPFLFLSEMEIVYVSKITSFLHSFSYSQNHVDKWIGCLHESHHSWCLLFSVHVSNILTFLKPAFLKCYLDVDCSDINSLKVYGCLNNLSQVTVYFLFKT